MIRIVTFNAAMQDIRFLSRSLYRPVAFIRHRLAGLVRGIRDLNADIVFLQEIFHRDLQRRLYSELESVYPHGAGFAGGGFKCRLGNELLMLSKFPLYGESLIRFRRASVEERLFTSRGLYRCRTRLPGAGEVELITFHMSAGGIGRHPENRRMEALRRGQVDQLLDSACPDLPVIMAGDLNAGPHSSVSSYRALLQAGYSDAFTVGGGTGITWDPGNPLVAAGRENHLQPQRIDHVFINGKAGARLRPVNSRIVLHGPSVLLEDGRAVPVSDHYGILVDFRLCR